MELLSIINHLYHDMTSYNISMVLNYLVISTVALGICLAISRKLKIYQPKLYRYEGNNETEN